MCWCDTCCAEPAPCPPFKARRQCRAGQLQLTGDGLAATGQGRLNVGIGAAAQLAGRLGFDGPAEPGCALTQLDSVSLPLIAGFKMGRRVRQLGLVAALAVRARCNGALVIGGLSKGERHAIQVPLYKKPAMGLGNQVRIKEQVPSPCQPTYA